MGSIGKNLLSYFFWFVAALYEQLLEDQERWGDEWKKRPIEANEKWGHQNDRIELRFAEYWRAWEEDDIPIPWLKVCGNAFIAWVREQWPDEYMLEEGKAKGE